MRMYSHIVKEHKEWVISNQVLRSGTSIGANVTEALYGISKKDFLAKMYIAMKEAAETCYWIELLHDNELITDVEHASIKSDATELLRMLTSICKTTRASMDGDGKNSSK